jgi:hypothetical protein
LLLEVWNDNGDDPDTMPASPEDFMGEAKIELELPPDVEIKGGELRLRLRPNDQVVKREVTGHLTVRYDWFPAPSGTDDDDDDGDYSRREKLLHGTLRLEIISASNLINTDWGQHNARSNPYVMAVCYPTSPGQEETLHPIAWRSPTAPQSLNPWWQCGHDFVYLWYAPIDTPEYRAKMCSEVSCSRLCDKDKASRFESGVTRSNTQAFVPDSPVNDEVAGMIMQLTASVPKLAASLAQIQEQVGSLSSRVDHISASVRDRSGSRESHRRPASRDLRGLARGEQTPGRERDMKASWDRSDMNNGLLGGATSPTSSPLEDTLEEIMNVGVVVSGGPNALTKDIVADAASLPHAIPH